MSRMSFTDRTRWTPSACCKLACCLEIKGRPLADRKPCDLTGGILAQGQDYCLDGLLRLALGGTG